MTAARVALVTGAARGIGAATTRRFVADGYRVVAFDLCSGDSSDLPYPLAMPADLDAVVADGDGSVVPFVGDARDPQALAAAVAVATERWGRLDAVVAGAAIMLGGAPQWETPRTQLDQLWESDLVTVWNTAQATIPTMLNQADPSACRFVAIASAAAHHGLYALSAYTVVKHAVAGLVRGLAADLTGTGIAAIGVSPGSTDTAMLRATAEVYGVGTDELISHQRIGRVITPDEIAAAVALCCSPAGAALHGTVIEADGGFDG